MTDNRLLRKKQFEEVIKALWEKIKANFVEEVRFDSQTLDPANDNKPKNTLYRKKAGTEQEVVGHVVTEWKDLKHVDKLENVNLADYSQRVVGYSYGREAGSGDTWRKDDDWSTLFVNVDQGSQYTIYAKTTEALTMRIIYTNSIGGEKVQVSNFTLNTTQGDYRCSAITLHGSTAKIAIQFDHTKFNTSDSLMVFKGSVTTINNYVPYSDGSNILVKKEVSHEFDPTGTGLESTTICGAIKELDKERGGYAKLEEENHFTEKNVFNNLNVQYPIKSEDYRDGGTQSGFSGGVYSGLKIMHTDLFSTGFVKKIRIYTQSGATSFNQVEVYAVKYDNNTIEHTGNLSDVNFARGKTYYTSEENGNKFIEVEINKAFPEKTYFIVKAGGNSAQNRFISSGTLPSQYVSQRIYAIGTLGVTAGGSRVPVGEHASLDWVVKYEIYGQDNVEIALDKRIKSVNGIGPNKDNEGHIIIDANNIRVDKNIDKTIKQKLTELEAGGGGTVTSVNGISPVGGSDILLQTNTSFENDILKLKTRGNETVELASINCYTQNEADELIRVHLI